MTFSGSPPRMRGKHVKNYLFPDLPGITPADAGKTVQCNSIIPDVQDHPRGCGENSRNSPPFERGTGSPPRMRGKHEWELPIYASDRITPADAGKTRRGQVGACPHEDHPRGCGENQCGCRCQESVSGSPPRMRGKLGIALFVKL